MHLAGHGGVTCIVLRRLAANLHGRVVGWGKHEAQPCLLQALHDARRPQLDGHS